MGNKYNELADANWLYALPLDDQNSQETQFQFIYSLVPLG